VRSNLKFVQAQEGVKVCVLIWDDRTSVNMAGMKAGMLHTHDEETHTFFQGTGVSVGKSLRCAPQLGFGEQILSLVARLTTPGLRSAHVVASC